MVLRGMEFKNVYLINCNEENIPHVNSIDNNLEEERRLFYVGITRAIDNVW
ncbi:MAG TPA: 3'-5' exonuclease, partial [Clostridium sp.]